MNNSGEFGNGAATVSLRDWFVELKSWRNNRQLTDCVARCIAMQAELVPPPHTTQVDFEKAKGSVSAEALDDILQRGTDVNGIATHPCISNVVSFNKRHIRGTLASKGVASIRKVVDTRVRESAARLFDMKVSNGKRMFLSPLGQPKRVTVVNIEEDHRVENTIPFSDSLRPVAITADQGLLFQQVDGLIGFEVASVSRTTLKARVEHSIQDGFNAIPSRSHGLGIRPDQAEVWSCNVEHRLVHVHSVPHRLPRSRRFRCRDAGIGSASRRTASFAT